MINMPASVCRGLALIVTKLGVVVQQKKFAEEGVHPSHRSIRCHHRYLLLFLLIAAIMA